VTPCVNNCATSFLGCCYLERLQCDLGTAWHLDSILPYDLIRYFCHSIICAIQLSCINITYSTWKYAVILDRLPPHKPPPIKCQPGPTLPFYLRHTNQLSPSPFSHYSLNHIQYTIQPLQNKNHRIHIHQKTQIQQTIYGRCSQVIMN